MTKPQTIEDLPRHEREPHRFAQIDLTYLTVDLDLAAALLAVVAAARKTTEFEVSEEGNEIMISFPLTEKEMGQKVAAAQRIWDYQRERYDALYTGTEKVESWARYQVDRYAEDEGLEAPDWDRHDARFTVETGA